MARAQLVRAGVTAEEVKRRLATGRLHRIHRGVYLVGHPVAAPMALHVAALLATGPGAVLSHRTAAALHGLLDGFPGIDVTVPTQRRQRDGVRIHRDRLTEDDITRGHGLPVTTPLRTLRDLASLASLAELERAVAEAERRRLVTRPQLAQTTGPGAARLRAVVQADPAFTRSEAERKLVALIRTARLPRPRVNTLLAGHEVDFHWPDHRLVVEVDGYAFHADHHAFEADRERDADLLDAGQRVLRLTWRQLTTEPEAVVARLARALANR